MKQLIPLFLPFMLFACTQMYTVHSAYTENYMGNARLSLTTDAEGSFLAKRGADELILGFPRNTRITKEAASVIKSFDSLCTYRGRKETEHLLLVFSCGEDIEVHPEIGSGYIDLIFTKKRTEGF